MTKYFYFVCFQYPQRIPPNFRDPRTALANTVVTTDLPITTIEGVRVIENTIEKHKPSIKPVVVVNYQLLRIEEETDATVPTL